MTQTIRTVTRVVMAQPTSDGAGVKLYRSIASPALDMLDPFLLLDEFRSDEATDYLAGFPDHPHRGFETVTYMLAGAMRHRDHKGNEGHLTAGSLQWMTAGRGIIHSEMPEQHNGLLWGFQLWVNLPAAEKMAAPRYQDIPPETVPEIADVNGVRVRVLAGESHGRRGPVRGICIDPLYLEVQAPAHAECSLLVPPGHTAFCYVFEGEGAFGETATSAGHKVNVRQLAIFSDGDRVAVKTVNSPVRFLLLAGRPLREPVARYGPFVMNTREEIVSAFEDYQRGRFLDE